MRKKEGADVGNLLEYEEQTAGRIMNPNVFALSEDMTVAEAIAALQASRDVEMVFYLYVVDERRHLVASCRCGACCSWHPTRRSSG